MYGPHEKVIQIMPAPEGLYSVYLDDDGTTHDVPVVCLGLTEEGEVVLMDIDSTGYIDTTASNFKEIKWK